jgi:flagellar motor protein MotB
MMNQRTILFWAMSFGAPPLLMGQDTVPLYNVTVIEHSLQAVNYQYRSGPTEIDFRGTILLGKAKGRATVESHRGRTEIDAKLQGLTSPQGFGREYLTYVLWAISPEGAAHNLGEIVAGGSDNAHVRVTTDLQAFGLLVTAEPYAAVRQPSDVVVLENVIRPETIGKIEPIQAKAELLPRGHYLLDRQKSQEFLNQEAPKVSMGEYEQLSQIYQAENALALARTVNADTLAADTYGKAQQLLQDAKQKHASKAGTSFVVQSAREAAQTADDARVIAMKRADEQKVASAEQRATSAEHAAQQARAEADAARAQAEAEREARVRAEGAQASEPAAEAVVVTQPVAAAPPPPPPPATPPSAAIPSSAARQQAQDATGPQTQLRGRILMELKRVTDTRDTPRGLVVVIPDLDFSGANPSGESLAMLTRVAQIVAPTGLQVTVEGHVETGSAEALSWRRAEAVRDALINNGLRMNSVTAKGLGNTKPTTSNATETGRIANRRVEIVISGGQIGDTPLWDKTYGLSSR